VLLSFVLAPLVRLFRRWHAGRIGGVLAAVLLAFLVIFGLSAIITQQIAQLASNLPRYQQTISNKIQSLQGAADQPGILNRLSHMLGDLRQEISKPQEQRPQQQAPQQPGSQPPGGQAEPAPAAPRAAPEGTPQKPVPVEIQQPPPKPMEVVQRIIAPLLAPLATAGVVIVFVIFMLLFREDLRDRFVRLAGAQDLGRTSEAMDDAGQRLSRYFLTQTCLNTAFGVIVGIGLWLIGIPNPVLWGVFAALMRFVPYIGAFVAAAFPAALAIAVDPGWSMLVWTVGLFVVVEPILGQLVEPLLYGHNTGLSPVAVIVAAAFWTWLWGPIGLLLSTPLTVCLVVLGRHVERLEFLDVILGDRPALTPVQSFFQRMLAGDPDEAADQAEEFMKKKTLCDFYDEVAIPGLLLARRDAQRGLLDAERLRRIREAVEGVVDDLSDHEDICIAGVTVQDGGKDAADKTEAESAAGMEKAAAPPMPVLPAERLKPDWRGEKPVLCIGVRDPLDEAAAAMIAQLLDKHGIGARVEPCEAASASRIFELDPAGVAMVCVSCLGSPSPVQLRYFVRRLRRRLPRAILLVGLWGPADDGGREKQITAMTGADRYARSLRQALELTLEAAQHTGPGEMPAMGEESAAATRMV
jgi:predicted PurR-regulated permease PerM